MRVAVAVDVAAPPEAIWEVIEDPSRALGFYVGVTRWELASDVRSGVGARFNVLMRVGSAEVGSLIEVVESVRARELAWSSITGIDQRGRWRLRPRGRRTRVELRLAYGIAGAGIPGLLAERLSAPQVKRNLRASLLQLKRQVEHEELRRAAERRRAERARVAAA
jgi:uncharacterized membrane protein